MTQLPSQPDPSPPSQQPLSPPQPPQTQEASPAQPLPQPTASQSHSQSAEPSESQDQPAIKRVIDENTDLSTLTDEEIKELNKAAQERATVVQSDRVSQNPSLNFQLAESFPLLPIVIIILVTIELIAPLSPPPIDHPPLPISPSSPSPPPPLPSPPNTSAKPPRRSTSGRSSRAWRRMGGIWFGGRGGTGIVFIDVSGVSSIVVVGVSQEK